MHRHDTAALIALLVIVATGFTVGTVVAGATAMVVATGLGIISGPSVRRAAAEMLDTP